MGKTFEHLWRDEMTKAMPMIVCSQGTMCLSCPALSASVQSTPWEWMLPSAFERSRSLLPCRRHVQFNQFT